MQLEVLTLGEVAIKKSFLFLATHIGNKFCEYPQMGNTHITALIKPITYTQVIHMHYPDQTLIITHKYTNMYIDILFPGKKV